MNNGEKLKKKKDREGKKNLVDILNFHYTHSYFWALPSFTDIEDLWKWENKMQSRGFQ